MNIGNKAPARPLPEHDDLTSGAVPAADVPRTQDGDAHRPDPGVPRRDGGEPPATDTERTIAGIWCAVLGIPDVGVLDNFFEIGGHSLLMHVIRDRITRQLVHAPTIVTLFQYPTIRALADHLDGKDGTASGPRVRSTAERRNGLARLGRRARRVQPAARPGDAEGSLEDTS